MLAAGCGYGPAEFDRVTLADCARIQRYWEKHPPTHLLLQALLESLGGKIPPGAIGPARSLGAASPMTVGLMPGFAAPSDAIMTDFKALAAMASGKRK